MQEQLFHPELLGTNEQIGNQKRDGGAIPMIIFPYIGLHLSR